MALAAGLLGRSLVVDPGLWTWSPIQLGFFGLAATVVKAIASIFLAFGENRVSARVGHTLRKQVVAALVARGLHDAAPRVLATIAVRVREVELAAQAGGLTGVRAAAQLVPLAAALIFVSPLLAIVALAALAPFGVVIARLRRRMRRSNEEAQRLVEDLHGGVDELVGNVDLFRTHGAGARVAREIDELSTRAGHAAARVDAGRAALSSSNEVLGALALIGVVAIANHVGVSVGDGTLIVFAALFFMAYRPLRDLGDARSHALGGAVALAALESVIESTPDAPPASEAPPLCARHSLSVERVGARARGPRTTFTVAPGAIVCVVGPTGSGKTTLLRALLGLEAAAGTVRYGDTDITDASVGPGARPFAWVPQDAPLITGTVLANVALLSGDEQEARDALDAIGATSLRCRAAVIVGPGGQPLSGGERRQVAIARAVATGLPVLLLDEPTEGLDPESTSRVLDALERLRAKRSIVIVTHRREICAIADAVVPLGGA